jgi:hypothetical protein
MESRYHRQITREAIGGLCAPEALQAITRSNLAQHSLFGLLFHPEYHYDGNMIDRGNAYVDTQRQIALELMTTGADIDRARAAFGRLAHAVQDFYAHSNYAALWLEKNRNQPNRDPIPKEIHPLDEDLLVSSELHTARLYYPQELISFIPIPGMATLMARILPPDSHTRMNLDGPQRGRLFPYAFAAARARTRLELARLLDEMSAQEATRFCGG